MKKILAIIEIDDDEEITKINNITVSYESNSNGTNWLVVDHVSYVLYDNLIKWIVEQVKKMLEVRK